LLAACLLAAAAKENVTISGQLAFLEGTDSVRITIFKYYCFASVQKFTKIYSGKINGDQFKVNLPAPDRPSFIYINFSRLDKNISGLLIEPGDDIFITEKEGRYIFTGQHAAKYNVAMGLDSTYRRYHPLIDENDPSLAARQYFNTDSATRGELSYLER